MARLAITSFISWPSTLVAVTTQCTPISLKALDDPVFSIQFDQLFALNLNSYIWHLKTISGCLACPFLHPGTHLLCNGPEVILEVQAVGSALLCSQRNRFTGKGVSVGKWFITVQLIAGYYVARVFSSCSALGCNAII